MNIELQQQLSQANMFFMMLKKIYLEIKPYEESTKECENAYRALQNRQSKSTSLAWASAIGGALAIFYALFLCSDRSRIISTAPYPFLVAVTDIWIIIVFFFGFGFLIGMPLFLNWRDTKLNERYQEEAREYWQTTGGPTSVQNGKIIAEIKQKCAEFNTEYGHLTDFLPEEYCNSTVIPYLLNYVSTGRADTLKEALNLYEEQKFRWEMESRQRNMMEEIAAHNARMEEYAEETARQTAKAASIAEDIHWQQMYEYYKSLSE